jgi:hypothetical protein
MRVLSAAFDNGSGQKLGLVLRKPGDKESVWPFVRSRPGPCKSCPDNSRLS